MKTNKFYVPILKWKKGEQEALKNLTNDRQSKITPLIEIIDYQRPDVFLECLKVCYPFPVFIDTIIAAEDDRDFLLSILQESHTHDQQIYPIFYFDDLQEAELFAKAGTHIGIRIPLPEDIDGPSYADLFDAIKKLKLGYKEMLIDLILDANIISEKIDANRQFREVKDVIKCFLLDEIFYNSVIISSTSFPESISSVPAGGLASFSRYDFKIFERVHEDPLFSKIKDYLIYSDYGVTKFTDTEIDFSIVRYILPKVKYTTCDKYLVLKGQKDRNTRKTIVGYKELSNKVIDLEDYYGENFSHGDLEIKERALGLNKKGPGNNTNWVTIAANHHIAVVLEQLSSLYETSTSP
jgi:hypothetical protein